MFLFQKFKYEKVELIDLKAAITEKKPQFIVFDTETTGLNFMTDLPFLISAAFDKYYVLFEPSLENMELFYKAIDSVPYAVAHNAKFDWHMLYNYGTKFPKKPTLVDGLIIARLTTFADEDSSISLEALGVTYVDKTAKFASDVIKKRLKEINSERLTFAKTQLKEMLAEGVNLKQVWDAYGKRVQFVETEFDEYFEFLDTVYQKPTYLDVWLDNPNLMESYAIDDVIILNEYIKKALPVVENTIGFGGVFAQESSLISVIGEVERNGLKIDVDKLIQKRKRLLQYIDETYDVLFTKTGQVFTSGQHKVIMGLMLKNYNIAMTNCDKKALINIIRDHENTEAAEVAELIIELRTLDKWLSTYIDGMLNRVQNGRVHTDIKNYGAVTGRVSSDLQQQPKEMLLSRTGEALFHPREVFINEEDCDNYYFDYSQMELRVQAHYVLTLSDETSQLARAFMPHNCVHAETGKIFDLTTDNIEDVWLTENDVVWQPIDVHTETTLKAFPNLTKDNKNFEHYRSLGKRVNFLKNYAGGAAKIAEALDISFELAQTLDKAYYEAFPEIKKHYQQFVNNVLYRYGYIDNLYGRRYYIQNSSNYYKAYNYLVQGSCADILKQKELALAYLFEGLGVRSKILLPIHDELQISIHKNEHYLLPIIKEIMDDIELKVPMTCDVKKTDTNWAEAYEVKI